MVASVTPNPTAPVLAWDKKQQLKPKSKKNNPLLAIGALVVVLLLGSGIWRVTHSSNSGQWVKVVSAGKDIPAGTRLGFMSVRFLDVPKQFATPEMVTSLKTVEGRVTRDFIAAGEPVKNFMLFPGHDGASLSLESDERAITLQLSDDAIVDHLILPDDLVDVVAISTKDGKKYTKTICQCARVLVAVPKEEVFARGARGSTNNMITLAVAPDFSEKISEAVENGKIRLVLRNRLTREPQELAGASPDDLLPACATSIPPPPPQPKVALEILPPPPTKVQTNADTPPPNVLQWVVEMFAGNHRETYEVPQR